MDFWIAAKGGEHLFLPLRVIYKSISIGFLDYRQRRGAPGSPAARNPGNPGNRSPSCCLPASSRIILEIQMNIALRLPPPVV